MNAEDLLKLILPKWRTAVAPTVGAAWFDGFVEQYRAEIIKELAPVVAVIAGSKRDQASEQAPPDEWTPARRTKANLEAMEILAAEKAPGELTPEERRSLRRYSGWGGLSIDKNRDRFPEGWDPETFGLIHEYYTPSRVARAIGELVCPLLDGVKGKNGRILALEPSAGIGRLIHGVEQARCPNKPPIDWITVEYSKVSSAILPRLWPQHEHHAGSFEGWIDRNSTEHGGQWKPDFFHKIQLVVSNPPYGERGLSRRQDPVGEYKAERMAYAYFMRRCLDLLVPRGIGVFLVPAGFLTGRTDSQQVLREKILRRHHLAAAYRLPSQLFPGAQLVTDLLVWRARGGALAEVDENDEFIARGEYFDEFPENILGKEEGRDYGRDDQLTERKKGRSWYRVVGTFEELPDFWERGFCTSCRIKPFEFPSAASRTPTSAVRKLEVSGDGHTPAVEAALYLGVRIGTYLKALAAEAENAPLLWKDLYTTLVEFWDSKLRKDEAPDNPREWNALAKLAAKGDGPAQVFLNAWAPSGELVDAIRTAPVIPPRWSGAPDDVAGQAQYLYLAHRYLTLEELERFHRGIGGPYGRDELLEVLLAADWNLDPTSAPEVRVSGADALTAFFTRTSPEHEPPGTYVTPLADYVTGVLWPKYDHASSQDGEQWRKQAERLRKAIDEIEFDDIEAFSPQDGWVPASLVSDWAQATISPSTVIDRDKGLYSIKGLDYSKPESFKALVPESLWLLGWLNHEASLFRPSISEDEKKARKKRKESLPSLPEIRRRQIEEWEQSFDAWIREDDERQSRLTDAYNRAFRGYTFPTYSQEPFDIARWSDKIKLYPHQVAGARRLLANRGGMLSFDTGVGKTYTLLAVLARARQEGWARRPVLITPVSLLWKWRNDFERALPDYRVAVIGSELHQRVRGDVVDEAQKLLADGKITEELYKSRITVSRADPKDRQADKWMAFISGAYDAVILSVEAMSAIKVDETSVTEYAENLAAVQRSIAITARNARAELDKKEEDVQLGKKKAVKDISERRRAIMQHKTAGWVADKLEGQKEEKDFVPGLTWSDLKVDLLLVDEAAMFKNLWGVVKAWGDVPKWIGNASPSNRAWQFDFRAAEVRRRNGGTGIALATATPFPNGVGDAFSMMKYIDAKCWERMGIDDPYQFVDQFVKIEDREYIDESSFNIKTGPAVVGFNNLEKLRTVILRYGEFRTAKDVGLDRIMPEPRNQQIFVDLDETQESKYSYEVARLEKLLTQPKTKEELAEIEQIRSELLAIQAKLTLVALHGHADEGYTWDLAREGGIRTKKVLRRQIDRFLADGWTLAAPLKDNDTEATVSKFLPKPDPNSPKGLKCAELILAQRNCGHTVNFKIVAA
ncbi:MAG: N-6 DNA methylase [Myxococcales bacterium]|nr:N-6 DNA methylase [Myxococcales bacterium]